MHAESNSESGQSPVANAVPPGGPGDITRLLRRMGKGDRGASDEVFAAVYKILRAQARVAMRGQAKNHTLQPTALANEAFLKLAQQAVPWESRTHLLSVSAQAMRCILVDHARTKSRRKRKTSGQKIELDEVLVAFEDRSFDLIELDDALRRLTQLHARASRVVELRFFGGLKWREISNVIGAPIRTVERDWEFARAWLHAEMS
jgi:RNA polymerase sigma factor (TIGR02999 family)